MFFWLLLISCFMLLLLCSPLLPLILLSSSLFSLLSLICFWLSYFSLFFRSIFLLSLLPFSYNFLVNAHCFFLALSSFFDLYSTLFCFESFFAVIVLNQFVMFVNIVLMFSLIGVVSSGLFFSPEQNVRIDSKLLYVVIKMYVVYYLIAVWIYFAFNYFSLYGIILIVGNLIKFNGFTVPIVFAVSLIAFLIILNSINYLSYVESFYFILLLLCFYLIMYSFVVSFNMSLLFVFVCWEYLGLVSYLLINYWLTRINCGIKTLLYNRIGDCSFLLIISIFYSYYYTFSLVVFNMYLVIFPSFVFGLFVLLMFASIFFSKSAVLPFSSWLISAMAAPIPVSSLLHSSTMVIAGIIFGYLSFSSFITYFILNHYYMFLLYNLFLSLILLTLLYSCFYLLLTNDIKQLIAYSTINQLTYIFFGLFSFNSIFSIYHIITHAFFKSLLFLLAGSLIHISLNFQSFYRLKSYCYLLKSLFIISLGLSLFNYSKEFILNYSLTSLSFSTHFYLFTACILVSFVYSFKLFVAIFSISYSFVSFSSFILVFYGLSVLFVDSLFYNVFNYASLSFNSFNLSFNLIFNLSLPLSLYTFVYFFGFIFIAILNYFSLPLSPHFPSLPTFASLNNCLSVSLRSNVSLGPNGSSFHSLLLPNRLSCLRQCFLFSRSWFYLGSVAFLLGFYSLASSIFSWLVVILLFVVVLLLWPIPLSSFLDYFTHGSFLYAIVSYLNFLGLSYFNFLVLLFESFSLRFSYQRFLFIFSFIPLSVILLFLV